MAKTFVGIRIDDDLLARLPHGDERGDLSRAIREAIRFYLELKDNPRTGRVPTAAELETMREQVLQTQAIGRNLNQLIRERYAIAEGKESKIEAIEWENLHRLISDIATDMQKIVSYWSRK